MKKLLAAVTSIVMSTSFTASAFASSITVSAAGGASAVQPNVSLEEAIDGAATKGAADDVMADFIIEGEHKTAKPGETVNVGFIAKAGGHKSATMVCELDTVPAGITYEMNDPLNYCFEPNPAWVLSNRTYRCETRAANEDPQDVIEECVINFDFTLPADIAPGDYEITFERFHVVEQGKDPTIEYNTTVTAAVITVEGEGIVDPPTPTQPPTDPNPSTGPSVSQGDAKMGDFIIEGEYKTAKPGETVNVGFIAKANGHKSATMVCELDTVPAGITYEMSDPLNYCFEPNPAWVLSNRTYRSETRAANEDPQDVAEDCVINFDFTLPADIAPGDYEITFERFHVVEQGKDPTIEGDCTVIAAVIHVEGEGIDNPTQPATPAPTNPATPAPTEPNTPAPTEPNTPAPTTPLPAIGTASWVIDTVHAKAGETVEVKVFVNGDSTLEISGATYTITANGADFAGVSATNAAYGNAAITNNPATNEFAFAQGEGKGNAASNGAVIMTLTYNVPATAKGTIPVDWSNLTVSDAFGNLITENVSLTDGAIIIDDEEPTDPPANGTAKWVIDTVHAKAGTTVELNVFVDGDSDLEVAGATYTIAANGADFAGVSASCAAYGNAAITNNASTNEFAFAQAAGQANAAKDKAVIMTITYDVPAGAKGVIPVTWANVTVSDTNGNLITEKVAVEDGAIIIDDDVDPVNGTAKWVIDEVHTKAGTTVQLSVYVDGDSDLEVAGASFGVTANGVTLSGVTDSSAAYGNAPITSNLSTSEIAFAQAAGQANAAKDKAVIMTLTYEVPAGATGRIPVQWANVVVSDTNGNLITEKVVTVDGAIIIDDETTEALTDPATTAAPTEPETTEPATPAPTEPVTTAAPTEPNTPAPTEPITHEPAAEGTAVWVIDEVHAKAGSTVQLPVFVSGDSDLEIAGASYAILADVVSINGVSDSCAAYGNAAITANTGTSEFAFAQTIGQGSAASDNAVIMIITYNVPEGATGRIPVEWANVVVSDTNGNIITEKVELVNGAIIIDEETTAPPTEPDTTAAPTEPDTTAAPTEPETTEPATPAPTEPDTTAAPTEPVTTAPPIAEGNVAWVLDNVTGVPGETVTLTMTVLDPNGTKLAIGGANFALAADPALVGAAGTPYGAELIYNLETREFAFADAIGSGVPSENGAVMMQLQYTIPEDAVPGTVYPVSFKDISVSDEFGNELADKVLELDGSIRVVAPVTTAEPTEPATTDANTDPATTAEPTAPVTTAEPTEPPTEPITAAPGAIIWQGDTVYAAPGEEVTLSFVVRDPNNAALEIGGAKFTVDADGNVLLVGADGSTAYSAELTLNNDTKEYAFAHATGEGIAAADGSAVVTFTFVVPENANDGDEYPVNLADLVVSDTNGLYITDQVLVIGGKIVVRVPATTAEPTAPVTTDVNTDPVTTAEPTTSTTTSTDPHGQLPETVTTSTGTSKGTIVIPPDQTVTVKASKGYFFSHDPRPFPGELVQATAMIIDDELVDFDPSLVTFEDTVNGGNTPEKAYRIEQTDFTYLLNVYYDGEPVYFDTGERVTVTAYIGVKGDSDLDNAVNSADATNALAYYANMQTGGVPDETRLTPESNEIVNAHPELDVLCAFLVDVDLDCYSKDNWRKTKSERTIDASDASWVLVFYANEQTGMAGQAHENWNQTLADTGRGEHFDEYVNNGVIFD